jgi:hypothetical protein
LEAGFEFKGCPRDKTSRRIKERNEIKEIKLPAAMLPMKATKRGKEGRVKEE